MKTNWDITFIIMMLILPFQCAFDITRKVEYMKLSSMYVRCYFTCLSTL